MKGKLLLAAVIAVSCGALPARAASYTLSVGNPDISGYTGPYGTVTVNLTDSTHATVTFSALSGFVFVGNEANDFNVNGSATASVGLVTPGSVSLSLQGSGNVSMFGTFDSLFKSPNAGPSGRFTGATFNLTAGSGTTWSSDADVLIANADGYLVAAHIGVGGLTGDLRATGYAGNGDTPVPDGGSTLALLGLALLGLGSLRGVFARS